MPAIVRWPGTIPAGRVSAEPASALDLFPTFVAMAGGELPRDRTIDGVDILPLLTGEADSQAGEFFYFDADRIAALRQGKWKLRVHGRGPELFDLEVDPGERIDLAARHPEVVARLRARMRDFQEEVAPAADAGR